MVLQLVDEGRVDLDAPLSTYLPDTPVGGDVTVRALLSHQSGIPDFTLSPDWQADVPRDPARWFTPDELVGYAAAMGPNGPDQGGYSNTNYILLGKLIERLEGTDLATALADRITGPLGLTTTRLATEAEPDIDGLAGGWTTGDLDGIPLAGDPDTPPQLDHLQRWILRRADQHDRRPRRPPHRPVRRRPHLGGSARPQRAGEQAEPLPESPMVVVLTNNDALAPEEMLWVSR